jgi:hypothetical protein
MIIGHALSERSKDSEIVTSPVEKNETGRGASIGRATRVVRRGRKRLILALALLVAAALIISLGVILWPKSENIQLDFTLPEATSDPPGRSWNLASHLREGKPILLEFMHPGLFASRNFNPTLLSLQNSSYGAEILIVSIAVTTDVPGVTNPPTLGSVQAFAENANASWTFLVETSGTSVRDMYDVVGVPTIFLLQRDGQVAWSHQGSVDYQTLEDQVRQVI